MNNATPRVQDTYDSLILNYTSPTIFQEAYTFAKALLLQQHGFNITVCNEEDAFISQTPTSVAVSGFYTEAGMRKSFSYTVAKNNGRWASSVAYQAADTKAGTNFVVLWLLIMDGCTLVGLLFYYLLNILI